MGCFFACFRFRSHAHRDDDFVLPQRSSSTARVSRNNLSSMFMFEDASSSTYCGSGEDTVDMELEDEAKFLKACGALLETPDEIRKATQKKSVQNQRKEGLLFESHSSLPDTSIKKLHWDEQTDQAVISRLLANGNSEFSACKSEREQNREGCDNNLTSLESENPADDPQRNGKSIQYKGIQRDVRYQTLMDSVYDTSTPNFGYKKQLLEIESKQSPYPTPLKLTDEMETPATVYPANHDNISTMRDRHVCSQHVYPAHGPTPSSHQNMGDASCPLDHLKHPSDQQVKDDSTNLQKQDVSSPNGNGFNCANLPTEDLLSLSTPENFSSRGDFDAPTCNTDYQQQAPAITMPSLSQWLKPPIPEDDRRKIREASLKDTTASSKSSDVDRPIIGMVAAHWNDETPTHISTKWWDGNGIPNSTNKYREDQKVNWHATSFEERLEKALSISNDNQLPGWKKTPKTIKFGEEDEECDTAASQTDSAQFPQSDIPISSYPRSS